jgi:hypothetical protein
LAELSGTLMSVDIDDVLVGDVMFMGGHLVRRVGTKPSDDRFRVGQDGFRRWQPLKLDSGPDASTSTGHFQTAEGQACLILRPHAD